MMKSNTRQVRQTRRTNSQEEQHLFPDMLPTSNSRRSPLLWFDEERGENRALRYASNQKSPFEDEQDGNVVL